MGNINICVIGIIFFSYNNFNSCKQPTSETIRCINVSYSIPLINRDGSVIVNDEYFNVYYYKELIMFQFHNAFDSTSNDSLITSEYRDNFFVYKKDSRYGFTYDQHFSRNHNKMLLVDSLLEKQAFQNFKWHMVMDTPIFKPRGSYFDSKTGILQETYIAPGDNGVTDNDTIFFYFDSKLKGIDFSLSKELDSVKSMKLYKIRLLYASSYNEEHKITFPKREIWIELKEVPVKNYEEILNYFRWYEKKFENKTIQN